MHVADPVCRCARDGGRLRPAQKDVTGVEAERDVRRVEEHPYIFGGCDRSPGVGMEGERQPAPGRDVLRLPHRARQPFPLARVQPTAGVVGAA